jgi:hypothetical protein
VHVEWPISVHTCVARETIAEDLEISYYVFCIENKMSYCKSRGIETLCGGEVACTNTALVYVELRSNYRHEHTTLGVVKRTDIKRCPLHCIECNYTTTHKKPSCSEFVPLYGLYFASGKVLYSSIYRVTKTFLCT